MFKNFGKYACACGMHSWSAVEPGSLHLTNGDFAIIGVLWAQLGTQKCMRPGCTATHRVVREGEFGYDGLNVYAGDCRQIKDRDVTTGWGKSRRIPAEVSQLEAYEHAVALERLGVPAAA